MPKGKLKTISSAKCGEKFFRPPHFQGAVGGSGCGDILAFIQKLFTHESTLYAISNKHAATIKAAACRKRIKILNFCCHLQGRRISVKCLSSV